jgi:hypothetical protein
MNHRNDLQRNHFFHPHEIERFLRELDHNYNKKLDTIIKRLKQMSKELDDLTARVHANSDVLDSAVALINGIAARIEAAGVDPVKLQALTEELQKKDDELAAAVVANTPAPQPVPNP